MATVYITQELKNRIKDEIDKMRRQEINNDFPGYDKTHDMEATHIYHLGSWGKEHLHLVQSIPKEWLRCDKSVNIRIDVPDNRTFSIGFSAPSEIFYGRPSTDYWSRAQSALTLDAVQELPEGTAGRAEIIQRWEDEQAVRDINSRWEKIKDDIMDFLDKCKSLNEAVKLLPSIRMYVRTDDLERLDRKVERPSQRKAIVADVDVEGITAAAIAAKLSAAL
jgi:predicted DNA binding CopG/RHH family protein